MTWLEKFQELCQKAPDNYDIPLPKPRKIDLILGTLPPHLIKMVWALDQVVAQANAVGKKHEATCQGDGSDDCKVFWKESASLEDQIDTIKKILFTSIREEMNINNHDNPNLAIAEGWRVVSIPREEFDKLEELLEMMGPAVPLSREFHD